MEENHVVRVLSRVGRPRVSRGERNEENDDDVERRGGVEKCRTNGAGDDVDAGAQGGDGGRRCD